MNAKNSIYWKCQIIGWSLYTTINLIFFNISFTTNFKDNLTFILWLPLGIGITHAYRHFIVKFHFLKTPLLSQSLIILVSSILMAIIFFFVNMGLVKVLGIAEDSFNLLAATSKVLSLVLIFFVWSIIYFGFHFFDNYKKTEILNLRLESNSKEIELNQLKAQLNPHFMFNSMNSIRALIDENPQKAKQAITQLSTILRHTLMMHKHKFIPLEDEMNLVKDYLELEHIRFEERLKYNINIDDETNTLHIPPMMIQTLVENAIKHGISKLPKGGEITIDARKINTEHKIRIINTGQLKPESRTESGVGIENSKERLSYLYGNKATFLLKNYDSEHVLSEIIITH